MYNSKKTQTIQDQWSKNAVRLTEWTAEVLVSRWDTYGVYSLNEDGSTWQGRALKWYDRKKNGPPIALTRDTIESHWRGERTIGLYAADKDDLVKCISLDIDNKTNDPSVAAKNEKFIRETLAPRLMGWQWFAMESNEHGGYHIRVPFREKVPYVRARPFGLWLAQGLDCEVFPKGSASQTGENCGNFVRLVLPKPGKSAYPRLLVGERWVADVDEIVTNLLKVTGNDPAAIPAEALAFAEPVRRLPDGSESLARGRVDWAEIGERYGGDLKTLRWLDVWDDREMLGRRSGTAYEVICPNASNHSPGEREMAIIWDTDDGKKYPGFYCHHAHCTDITIADALAYFGPDVIDAYCEKDFGANEVDNVSVDKIANRPMNDIKVNDFGDHPMTAYLWKKNHALNSNVTEEDRQHRSESVLAACDLIPESGFLRDWLQTYLPTTDCSPRFLLAAGLTVLATILNRRAWVNNGGRKLHSHLWLALLGQSGERKSTATNLVLKWLARDPRYQRTVSHGETTYAALAAKIGIQVTPMETGEIDLDGLRLKCAQEPADWLKGVCTLCIDEIGGFIKQLDLPYNANFKEMLTGVYEGREDFLKETATQGSYYFHKPLINIVGASTPAWLTQNVTDGDVLGGFLGRWLFVISDGPDYVLPLADQPDEVAFARLGEHIGRVKEIAGEYRLDGEALDIYCTWAKQVCYDQRLVAWKNRASNTVLKLVMLLQASASNEMEITPEIMGYATRYMDEMSGKLAGFVSEHIPESKDDAQLNKLRKIISTGRISHQAALKKSKMRSDEFRKLVNTLVENGEVVKTSQTSGTKPAAYYEMWIE